MYWLKSNPLDDWCENLGGVIGVVNPRATAGSVPMVVGGNEGSLADCLPIF
jgi:hypothetical protein